MCLTIVSSGGLFVGPGLHDPLSAWCGCFYPVFFSLCMDLFLFTLSLFVFFARFPARSAFFVLVLFLILFALFVRFLLFMVLLCVLLVAGGFGFWVFLTLFFVLVEVATLTVVVVFSRLFR
jgi:hypothetical protein